MPSPSIDRFAVPSTNENNESLLEMLVEFRDSVDENREMAATEIAHLDQHPHDMDTINSVFRALHNIKGNAKMCMLDRLSQFAHHVENIMSDIREGRLDYIPEIGEVALLTLDELRHYSELMSAGQDLDEPTLVQIETDLEAIRFASPGNVAARARRVIERYTGQIAHAPLQSAPQQPAALSAADRNHDLAMFRDLALLLDARFPYWSGRIDRTLPLLLKLNAAAPRPIDARQLEAAWYMHDVGNAFLPESVLLKEDRFTEREWNMIKQHPAIASALLRRMTGWEEAATIIDQHHVWADGTRGYPQIVAPDQLHEGAKMLAIVDSYEAMTHPRPDRQYRRSVLRAITEINNFAGKQFGAELVPVFNAVVREFVVQHAG
jgi:HPt (histidine-containing phosphotransfer) domain-containing protein